MIKAHKVSVIVPVYNVEAYLDKCLHSLAVQTLDDLQIIVVNDGTQDKSQSIIDDYVQAYPDRFTAYVKVNGGLADARNFGIERANGVFIGFIDSDDYVEPDMFERMYNAAIHEDADLVICDVLYEWPSTRTNLHVHGLKRVTHKSSNSESRKRAFLSPLFAWNKLYHHRFFTDLKLRYPVSLWYEDIPVSLPIFAHARKLAYINDAFVHYTQRSESIMSQINHKKSGDIFIILQLLIEYFKTHQLFDLYYSELEYVFIEQLMLYGSFRFLRADNKQLMYNAIELINELFPNWKRNRYIHELKFTYRLYLRFLNRVSMNLFRLLIN